MLDPDVIVERWGIVVQCQNLDAACTQVRCGDRVRQAAQPTVFNESTGPAPSGESDRSSGSDDSIFCPTVSGQVNAAGGRIRCVLRHPAFGTAPTKGDQSFAHIGC